MSGLGFGGVLENGLICIAQCSEAVLEVGEARMRSQTRIEKPTNANPDHALYPATPELCPCSGHWNLATGSN